MAKKPKGPKRGTVIYGLVDPRDFLVYYIGKTTNASRRLEGHLKDTFNKGRTAWIAELLALGLTPIMVILEVVPKGTPWQDRECEWIMRGRLLLWPLFNISDGGGPDQSYRNRPRRRRRAPVARPK